MRNFLLTLLFAVCAVTVTGQSRSEAYRQYQEKRRQAYTQHVENYRKSYADFMRNRWENYQSKAAVAQPKRKEPDTPVVKPENDDNTEPSNDKLPVDIVTDLPKGTPDNGSSQPSDGSAAPAVPTGRPYKFTFYGTECSVTLTAVQKFRLASTSESVVADVWGHIAAGGFDKVADECSSLARSLNLNDWGYYQLCRTVADGFCGAGSGESVLLQSFMLAERGVMVRLARTTDGRLMLLIATSNQLFGLPYLTIDNNQFYIFDSRFGGGSCAICNFKLPGERKMSMHLKSLPALTVKRAKAASRNSAQEKIETTVSVNANVMAFLNDYPACDWSYYAAVPLSESTKSQLYPALKRALENRDEAGKVGTLLRYLHTAFPYMTDDRQFGVERTLFAEEMYYYPYSDCEDRSILLLRLVEDLVGLKSVLLHYPNHIAVAVRFNGDVKGDYVMVDGRRYTVCDPTYIGASVGETMPSYKNTAAKVIRVN